MFFFVLVHIPLAIAMYRMPMLANLHGALTVLCCLGVVLGRTRSQFIALMMAYVVGAEILWRSTNSSMPYEAAKYLVSFLSFAALVRMKPFRIPWLPALYLLLLLPSVLLTLTTKASGVYTEQSTQKDLIFNMSGPVSLALATCFFMRVRLSLANFQNLAALLVAPSAGAAALTLFALHSATNVHFGRSGVSVIRDEFGPNQLSAAIGLGALFLFLLLLLDDKPTLKRRAIMIGGILALLISTALTFSRGGIYNFAGAAVLALYFTLRSPAMRLRLILLTAVTVGIGYYVVLPVADKYTGGALVQRFTNTGLTGRDEIAAVDVEIWRRNPIYGVGPGRGIDYRAKMYRVVAAHTEFTRMLCEHGTLGLLAFLVLLYAGGVIATCPREPRGRGVAIALAAWAFLYMTNAAMRLAGPSFVFGLSCASLDFSAVTAALAERKTARSQRRTRPSRALRMPETAPRTTVPEVPSGA